MEILWELAAVKKEHPHVCAILGGILGQVGPIFLYLFLFFLLFSICDSREIEFAFRRTATSSF